MDKYKITIGRDVYEFMADELSWDKVGLKAIQDNEVIALFREWDKWVNVSKSQCNG